MAAAGPTADLSAALVGWLLPPLALLLGPASPIVLLALVAHAAALLVLTGALAGSEGAALAAAAADGEGEAEAADGQAAAPASSSVTGAAAARDGSDDDDGDADQAASSHPAAPVSGASVRLLLPTAADAVAWRVASAGSPVPQSLSQLLGGFAHLPLLAWGLTAAHYYFATGHGNTFSSLQYAAAFVGWDEFSFVRSGALLAANTFAPHLLLLLALAPALAAILAASSYDAGTIDGGGGAGSGYDPARSTLDAVSAAWYGTTQRSSGMPRQPAASPAAAAAGGALALLATVQSAAALFTAVFALIARRHLMVWAIFAPKYVFDATTLLVVDGLVLAALALALVAGRGGGSHAAKGGAAAN
jgi:hypothetical protein